MPGRIPVVLWVALGGLALTTVALGIHAADGDARTAESVCRGALLAITPSAHIDDPLRVRNLNSIDTAAEPDVAEAVDGYAPSGAVPVGLQSTYIVQGNVRFGQSEARLTTCVIVLEGGVARMAPVFTTATD